MESEDIIDDLIKSLDEYYPGSKKKRRPANPEVEAKRSAYIDPEAWDSKPLKKKLSNGKEIELFSAGMFANALGRPLVTIRLWERRGYIPRAPYRLKSIIVKGEKKPGWRMYSRAMIESALKSFQSRGLLEAPRIEWDQQKELSIEIFENWTRLHNQETNNQ